MCDYRQKYLRAYPDRCVVCDSEEDVAIHHKDGDRDNDRLKNLCALCRGCHISVHGEKNLTGKLAALQMQLPPTSLRFGNTLIASVCVPIDSDVRDKLRGEKIGNETYSDVIVRLIENNE